MMIHCLVQQRTIGSQSLDIRRPYLRLTGSDRREMQKLPSSKSIISKCSLALSQAYNRWHCTSLEVRAIDFNSCL